MKFGSSDKRTLLVQSERGEVTFLLIIIIFFAASTVSEENSLRFPVRCRDVHIREVPLQELQVITKISTLRTEQPIWRHKFSSPGPS